MSGDLSGINYRGQVVPIAGFAVFCERCTGGQYWFEPVDGCDVARMLRGVKDRFVFTKEYGLLCENCAKWEGVLLKEVTCEQTLA